MGAVLLALAIIFTQLSLIAFGGGNTILPEMQRQVVDIHHWMTAQEFSALLDRKSTRLNSSHMSESRMPSSA